MASISPTLFGNHSGQLLEVVAIGRKNAGRYGFEKIVAFYSCPFCIVMPTSGGKKEGGGEEPGGGGVSLKVRYDDG
jgi:hypothetical protein